jgi:hypothetical protein
LQLEGGEFVGVEVPIVIDSLKSNFLNGLEKDDMVQCMNQHDWDFHAQQRFAKIKWNLKFPQILVF